MDSTTANRLALGAFSNLQLIAILRNRKLKRSGKKCELVERVICELENVCPIIPLEIPESWTQAGGAFQHEAGKLLVINACVPQVSKDKAACIGSLLRRITVDELSNVLRHNSVRFSIAKTKENCLFLLFENSPGRIFSLPEGASAYLSTYIQEHPSIYDHGASTLLTENLTVLAYRPIDNVEENDNFNVEAIVFQDGLDVTRLFSEGLIAPGSSTLLVISTGFYANQRLPTFEELLKVGMFFLRMPPVAEAWEYVEQEIAKWTLLCLAQSTHRDDFFFTFEYFLQTRELNLEPAEVPAYTLSCKGCKAMHCSSLKTGVRMKLYMQLNLRDPFVLKNYATYRRKQRRIGTILPEDLQSLTREQRGPILRYTAYRKKNSGSGFAQRYPVANCANLAIRLRYPGGTMTGFRMAQEDARNVADDLNQSSGTSSDESESTSDSSGTGSSSAVNKRRRF